MNIYDKEGPEDDIIRYKTRLVVQGFFQIFGVDYNDTYSPVAKFVSIRFILALSIQLGLIIHTMDVNTAFLNAGGRRTFGYESHQAQR